MAFATPEELASYLQQDLDRATATLALDSATARIEAVTRGWRFLPVASTSVTLRGGVSSLRLQRPLVAVTAVSSTSLGLVTAHVVNVDYEVLASGLRWVGWYGWPSYVTVTYTRGMAAIPGDVRDGCLQMAALRFTNPTLSGGGESIDDYTAPRYSVGDTSPEADILSAIRRAYPTAAMTVPLVRA